MARRKPEEAIDAQTILLDALGGIFTINGGGLPGDLGLMVYFAPDTQKWMPLEMRHSAFVQWSLSPQGEQFYADQQWFGWRDEVGQMRAGEVMSFYPPLGLETTSFDERSRRVVPGRLGGRWRLRRDAAGRSGHRHRRRAGRSRHSR